MEGKMKVAILGAGNIAGAMAEALNGITDDVCLYAVASRSLEKAQAFAIKWGFEKAYGSYEELAKDEAVDLVYIATPHSEHFANAMLCLKNGRNCLVEKAFCGNLMQTKQLIEFARKNKLLLAEAMWTRYQPSYTVIKNFLDSGMIGEPHYLESDFSVPIKGVERLVNPALAGGALLDLGVYSLTVPAMYFGTDIVKVTTDVIKTETGVDATTIVTLTYKNGNMAKTKCSAVDAESNYAKIVGDKGYLVFGPINVPNYVSLYDVDGNLQMTIDTEPGINGYEYEVLECREALLAGALETKSMPHSETIRMMGWMDSIRNHTGIVYPFENASDIIYNDSDIWGHDDVFDDEDVWDRSKTGSLLEIYDIGTNERTVLAEFDYVIEAPNWSHDDTFLTYNSEGKVYKFDLATKESIMIDSGELCTLNNDHVLATDDSEIAVSDETLLDGRSRIYRIPIDGGTPVLVTEKAPSYLHGWSPDMQKMCYCAERGGEYDIYEIGADGANEVRLTTAPGLNDGSEYDSQGEYIYFNSVRTGLMQAWRMKADGSEQEQLTFDNHLNTWFPHISPDRTKLVMISYYKGDLWPGDHIPNRNVELRVMELGSMPKTIIKLFGGQGTINVNSWSPDSKKIAFVSYKKI